MPLPNHKGEKMEFNRKPVVPAFEPITISLTSQAQVDFIAALIGASSPSLRTKFGFTLEENDKAYSLYCRLDEISSPNRPSLDALTTTF